MLLDNIQKLCRKNGTTICAVERDCGIANGTIGKWDARVPRVDTLKKVADHFGLTISQLYEEAKEE